MSLKPDVLCKEEGSSRAHGQKIDGNYCAVKPGSVPSANFTVEGFRSQYLKSKLNGQSGR